MRPRSGQHRQRWSRLAVAGKLPYSRLLNSFLSPFGRDPRSIPDHPSVHPGAPGDRFPTHSRSSIFSYPCRAPRELAEGALS
jgi:hypothetical protein